VVFAALFLLINYAVYHYRGSLYIILDKEFRWGIIQMPIWWVGKNSGCHVWSCAGRLFPNGGYILFLLFYSFRFGGFALMNNSALLWAFCYQVVLYVA